jgi:hypothetical protein
MRDHEPSALEQINRRDRLATARAWRNRRSRRGSDGRAARRAEDSALIVGLLVGALCSRTFVFALLAVVLLCKLVEWGYERWSR